MKERQSALFDFIKYASLSSLGMLAISCYILADTFFVSKGMGKQGLAALNMAIPVFSFMNGAGLMLGMGGATRYAIIRSSPYEKSAHKVYRGIVVLYIVLSTVMVSASFASPAISGLLGAAGDIKPMTSVYIRFILLFSPAFMLNNILLCYVRNTGAPSVSMAAMVTGSLSNVLLDYIFIFPLGMGMLGAVLATGIAPLISIAVISVYLIPRLLSKVRKSVPGAASDAVYRGIIPDTGAEQTDLSAHRPAEAVSDKAKRGDCLDLNKEASYKDCKMLLRLTFSAVLLGVPSFIAEVSSGVVILVFNYVILSLRGDTGVAAYGIIANIALVVTAVYTGISQGIQPLLSKAAGQNDRSAARKVLKYAVVTSLATAFTVLACVCVWSEQIVSVFNSSGSAQLADMAVPGLRLYFISGVFAGVNVVAASFFSSSGAALQAQAISVLRGLVFPVALSFPFAGLFEMTGVWLVVPASEFLVMLASVVMLVFAVAKHEPEEKKKRKNEKMKR